MKGIVLPGIAPSSYREVEFFINNDSFAIQRFKEASEVLGYSLVSAFREADETNQEVYEVCFLANSLALLDHFYKRYNYQPDFTIGVSFGGMSAAVQTNTLTYAEAVWLTHEAAKKSKEFFKQMKEDYQTHFIYNMSLDEAKTIIRQFQAEGMYLELVGFLKKVVCLCGEAKTIKLLKEKVNTIPKVSSLHTMNQPIHSVLLKDLKVQLEHELFNQIRFKPMKTSIISDVNGEVITDSELFKQSLLDGYDNPVRWDLVTDTMKKQEVSQTFVIGPRNLFAQLLKQDFNIVRISPDEIENIATL
ncbi:hypothetical protein P4U05_23965 [Bacillus paranthracis]|uniref:hypothetical protein n=1 Tax=Bacillus TaxID=1386 RepID=UPI000200F35C|nr:MULTISPECIES: hypothetical protein [Bacillus]ADY24331.1 hypothetical protein YBT020_25520 [Bacillus thuringiensis serovar finitimus YBT-020]MCW4575068.1 hypothetical protein [Bacillus pacificus]MRC74806.1 hypothetical protein [Bacillus thuringiensis]OTX78285.1 hypothetical protein BK722_00165 [Bacillus thuringiensis serovar finitimus]MBG9909210.1 hypothetical protein [Bacillus paranthracis]